MQYIYFQLWSETKPMPVMKQLLPVLTGSLFAMLLFAGCGGKSEKASTDEAVAPETQQSSATHQSEEVQAFIEAENKAKEVETMNKEAEAKAKEMAARAEAEAKKAMEDLQRK